MVKTNIDIHKVLDNFHLKHFHIEEMMSYVNPQPQDEFGQTAIKQAARHGFTDYVKILTPLTDNPNAPDEYGNTPIILAVRNAQRQGVYTYPRECRHTEIVKILAPLTDNPNAPDKDGNTPIHWAARNGLTEIVKILASLTNNPNSANKLKKNTN